MEIEVSETIRKKVEITFPMYLKSNCHHWKLISEKEQIVITNVGKHCHSIEVNSYQISAAIANGKECTEEEFNAALEAAKAKINSL